MLPGLQRQRLRGCTADRASLCCVLSSPSLRSVSAHVVPYILGRAARYPAQLSTAGAVYVSADARPGPGRPRSTSAILSGAGASRRATSNEIAFALKPAKHQQTRVGTTDWGAAGPRLVRSNSVSSLLGYSLSVHQHAPHAAPYHSTPTCVFRSNLNQRLAIQVLQQAQVSIASLLWGCRLQHPAPHRSRDLRRVSCVRVLFV